MRIGIDLGGTNIAAGLVDEDMHIVCKSSLPTNSKRPYTDIIKDMGTLVFDLVNKGGVSITDIRQVGIGCPGTVNPETGEVLYSNNLAWDHVPMFEELSKYVKQPLKIDNDANAAGLGEYLAGGAKGKKSCVLITLGTGLGGGIVIDGKILAGSHHAGAEIGHSVIVAHGVRCTCGQEGCWESYASATALIRMGTEKAAEKPDSLLAKYYKENGRLTGLTIFQAADAGDEAANEVVDEYIYYIAVGVTSMVNIFEPEAIVIGGGISAQGERLLEPIRRHVEENRFCKYVPMPEIVTATLGNDAGIIGAAFL